jgi:hypothetical protein
VLWTKALKDYSIYAATENGYLIQLNISSGRERVITKDRDADDPRDFQVSVKNDGMHVMTGNVGYEYVLFWHTQGGTDLSVTLTDSFVQLSLFSFDVQYLLFAAS